jgi:hypothetical protein
MYASLRDFQRGSPQVISALRNERQLVAVISAVEVSVSIDDRIFHLFVSASPFSSSTRRQSHQCGMSVSNNVRCRIVTSFALPFANADSDQSIRHDFRRSNFVVPPLRSSSRPTGFLCNHAERDSLPFVENSTLITNSVSLGRDTI